MEREKDKALLALAARSQWPAEEQRVAVLHPAPEPHHQECATGCSGAAWMAGPCQQQCAKTPEFQEQCTRDAEASRLRFRTGLGINALRAVPAADDLGKDTP